jgi:hypothetical protein
VASRACCRVRRMGVRRSFSGFTSFWRLTLFSVRRVVVVDGWEGDRPLTVAGDPDILTDRFEF